MQALESLNDGQVKQFFRFYRCCGGGGVEIKRPVNRNFVLLFLTKKAGIGGGGIRLLLLKNYMYKLKIKRNILKR